MSLASSLNDNDDINFPEIIAGNITCDTLTARVINGSGGGGGGGGGATLSSYFKQTSYNQVTNAPIPAGISTVISAVLQFMLPSSCTTAKLSISVLGLGTQFTVGNANPTTLKLWLGNFVSGTHSPDGAYNSWGCTFTNSGTTPVISYTSPDNTTIDLWYFNPVPFSSVNLMMTSTQSGSNSVGALNSIQMYGLITATNDTVNTITLNVV